MIPSAEISQLLHLGTELVLGKTRWKVIFNHRVLLKIEALTGLDVLGGEIDFFKLNSRTLTSVIKASYFGEEKLDFSCITPQTLPRIILQLREAWIQCMPVPKTSQTSKEGESNSQDSTKSWIEAWGNAREWLGLTDEEWLNYVPRMVQELSSLRKQKICQQEWMLAQIPATIANWSQGRRPGSPPADPKHYMLHDWDLGQDRKYANNIQSVEQQILQLARAKTVTNEDKKKLFGLINNEGELC